MCELDIGTLLQIMVRVRVRARFEQAFFDVKFRRLECDEERLMKQI